MHAIRLLLGLLVALQTAPLAAQHSGWFAAAGLGESTSRQVFDFELGASLGRRVDIGVSAMLVEGGIECLLDCTYGGSVGQVGWSYSPFYLGPVYPYGGFRAGWYRLPGRVTRNRAVWSPEWGVGVLLGERGKLRVKAFRTTDFPSGREYFSGVTLNVQLLVARFDMH